MNDASAGDARNWRSGKGHRDENFPVASWLIHPRHRQVILAFYNFVRTADDIADHAALPPEEKLALLDRLEAGLTGHNNDDAVAVRLRTQLAERNLSPRHAQDLLAAFRLDVTKLRYRDWDDLIALLRAIRRCRSAASCSMCTAKAATLGRPMTRCAPHCRSSIICRTARSDYRNLDRVYVPLDAFAACGSDGRSARRAAGIAGAARLPAPARRAHRAIAERER